ncbi:MAG TPA: choice-of-anchor Q domain-containing protein, partial [Verrucomicrobiota bacterium]|nr:choice-of-anchor Q domain-containing protein [Verrucomicrobiota bacterium]
NGVVIQRCDISKTRVGISLKATETIQNIEVADCQLHDYIVWCIDVAPRKAGATFRNITIRNSVFRDYHQHDSGNWQGCGEKPHTDGIFLRTAGMASTWENLRISSCDFYADYPGNSKGGTASIYVSQGPSVLIYNCTFRSDRHTRAIDVAARNPAGIPVQVVRIYNNSFLFSATPVFLASETNRGRREVYIQNNIMVRSGGRNMVMVNRDSGLAPVIMDNNLYWDPQVGSATRNVYRDKVYLTFAQTQARGYESNGIFADPRFVNTTTNPPSRRDLRLKAGSAAIRRGANLSAWFTQDKLGKPRPATGPWTFGAFEYP